VSVAGDKSGINLKGVKMSMNPFCEIAVEEAVRMKESKKVSEIVAISIGPKQSLDQIRQAMALGADSGIHIETDERIDKDIQPLFVSKILKHFVEKNGYD